MNITEDYAAFLWTLVVVFLAALIPGGILAAIMSESQWWLLLSVAGSIIFL